MVLLLSTRNRVRKRWEESSMYLGYDVRTRVAWLELVGAEILFSGNGFLVVGVSDLDLTSLIVGWFRGNL